MKKILVLALSTILLLVVSLTTWAGPIEVAVEPGFSVEVAALLDPASNEIEVSGNYGINQKLKVYAGYGTNSQTILIGGHYAFAENMAATLEYGFSGSESALAPGLCYKYDFNEQWAFAGEAEYAFNLSAGSSSALHVIGQAEYEVGDTLVLNGGIGYISIGSLSSSFIVIGAEYTIIENLALSLDYQMSMNTGGRSILELGISYSF